VFLKENGTTRTKTKRRLDNQTKILDPHADSPEGKAKIPMLIRPMNLTKNNLITINANLIPLTIDPSNFIDFYCI
jgi:hypothetical protein